MHKCLLFPCFLVRIWLHGWEIQSYECVWFKHIGKKKNKKGEWERWEKMRENTRLDYENKKGKPPRSHQSSSTDPVCRIRTCLNSPMATFRLYVGRFSVRIMVGRLTCRWFLNDWLSNWACNSRGISYPGWRRLCGSIVWGDWCVPPYRIAPLHFPKHKASRVSKIH